MGRSYPSPNDDDCDKNDDTGYDDLFDSYEMNKRRVEATQLPIMMTVI